MKNSQLESNPSCSPDKDALNFSDRLLVAAKVCAKTWKPSDFEKFKELFLEAKQKKYPAPCFLFSELNSTGSDFLYEKSRDLFSLEESGSYFSVSEADAIDYFLNCSKNIWISKIDKAKKDFSFYYCKYIDKIIDKKLDFLNQGEVILLIKEGRLKEYIKNNVITSSDHPAWFMGMSAFKTHLGDDLTFDVLMDFSQLIRGASGLQYVNFFSAALEIAKQEEVNSLKEKAESIVDKNISLKKSGSAFQNYFDQSFFYFFIFYLENFDSRNDILLGIYKKSIYEIENTSHKDVYLKTAYAAMDKMAEVGMISQMMECATPEVYDYAKSIENRYNIEKEISATNIKVKQKSLL